MTPPDSASRSPTWAGTRQLLVLLTLFHLSYSILAEPTPTIHAQALGNDDGIHLPLYTRMAMERAEGDVVSKAVLAANHLLVKYGRTVGPVVEQARRDQFSENFVLEDRGLENSTYARRYESRNRYPQGFAGLINSAQDSQYVASLSVGTPPVSYPVVIDTGSADTWLASSSCTASSCPAASARFDPRPSSSFLTSSTHFSVSYASGSASGVLVSDTLGLGGYSMTHQIFADCDTISAGLIGSSSGGGPITGLLGLAFQGISSSGATPFWESLAQSGTLNSSKSGPGSFAGFGIALTRYLGVSSAGKTEPGGILTLGATNSSLYTGSLAWNDVIQNSKGVVGYWMVGLTGVTVQNGTDDVGDAMGGSDNLTAVIDTGTSLIGFPPDVITALYNLIPDSQPSPDASYLGFYEFPCASAPSVSLTFDVGSSSYTIDPRDFNLGSVTRTMCLGAAFALAQADGAPQVILGATFLKNVYSAYRYYPPAVGFATLSKAALALSSSDSSTNPASESASAVVGGLLPSGRQRASSERLNAGMLSVMLGAVGVLMFLNGGY